MRYLLLIFSFLFSFICSYGQSSDPALRISPLTGNFYIYTTYHTYEGSRTPANGMYLVTDRGVVLFDTPWDTTQFQPLLDSIRARHNQPVTLCIATHWHSDRTEGLEYYRRQGIKTYTSEQTDELSKKNGKKRAEYLVQQDTVFTAGNYSFLFYYPGGGHTTDNMVVWFKKEKILYAGCLVKGADAANLGFLGDADVAAYYSTLKRVRKKFRKPAYIIISHSDWNNNRSLKHSIHLARALKKS